MARGHPFLLPAEIDIHDVNFARDMLSWSLQTQRDMDELVAATKKTLATSRDLMAQADRVLARR
jgi:hypothetical protein